MDTSDKYCLVAALTVEIDKESKLLPIFAPMCKKDEAIKEALTLCNCARSLDLELSAFKRMVGESSTIRVMGMIFLEQVCQERVGTHYDSAPPSRDICHQGLSNCTMILRAAMPRQVLSDLP